jgi:hypothetical protein
MLTHKIAIETKDRCHKAAIADSRDVNAKAPIIAFHDGFYFHFLGEDAKAIAKAIEETVTAKHDGVDHFTVDGRKWNTSLDKIHEAGHTVSVTDMPE